jgi:hypothetical protein
MNRLIKLFNSASSETVESGLCWYSNARDFLELVSLKTGFDLKLVCDACSALSPACSWDINKRDVFNVCEGLKKGIAEKIRVSTYGQFKVKAIRILEKEEEFIETATNQKTWNFKHNLFEPLNPDFVTIDRHAFKAYTGGLYPGSVRISSLKYKRIANAYKREADRIGILPNQLQAVVWTQYKIETGR